MASRKGWDLGAEVGTADRDPITSAGSKPVALGEPYDRGIARLVGEDHPKAHLTNEQVEAIRDAYEAGLEGSGPRIGYRALAKKYNTSKRTIRDIINLRRRNTWPHRWAVPRSRRRKPR